MSYCVIVILGCAIVFGILASMCMVIAVSTKYWEVSTFSSEKLQEVPGINMTESMFDEENEFFKVVRTNVYENGTTYTMTDLLRSTYGGIWQLCDKISGMYMYPVECSNIRIFTVYDSKPKYFVSEHISISRCLIICTQLYYY